MNRTSRKINNCCPSEIEKPRKSSLQLISLIVTILIAVGTFYLTDKANYISNLSAPVNYDLVRNSNYKDTSQNTYNVNTTAKLTASSGKVKFFCVSQIESPLDITCPENKSNSYTFTYNLDSVETILFITTISENNQVNIDNVLVKYKPSDINTVSNGDDKTFTLSVSPPFAPMQKLTSPILSEKHFNEGIKHDVKFSKIINYNNVVASRDKIFKKVNKYFGLN